MLGTAFLKKKLLPCTIRCQVLVCSIVLHWWERKKSVFNLSEITFLKQNGCSRKLDGFMVHVTHNYTWRNKNLIPSITQNNKLIIEQKLVKHGPLVFIVNSFLRGWLGIEHLYILLEEKYLYLVWLHLG